MPHTILSWDVGIKNLAYCIVKFEENQFTIKKWDIINILDDRLTCEYNLRGGEKKCGKIAKHIFTINEQSSCESKYYCKSHIDKADYNIIIPLDEIQCCKCKKNSIKIVDGTTHGWCEKHLEKDVEVYKRRCVKKINQQCTKQSLTKMGVSMFEKLDKVPELMDVDEVLIENQPVLKNPTMKTIACMLLSYFTLRGLYENKGQYTHDTLRHVSASGKLKVNNKTTNKELKKGKNEKEVYNITKGLSVKYTKAIINSKDLEHLNKYKKQDDLCDALLQAIRVYYGDNVPEGIALKLKTVKVDNKSNTVDVENPTESDELSEKIITVKKTKKAKVVKNNKK